MLGSPVSPRPHRSSPPPHLAPSRGYGRPRRPARDGAPARKGEGGGEERGWKGPPERWSAPGGAPPPRTRARGPRRRRSPSSKKNPRSSGPGRRRRAGLFLSRAPGRRRAPGTLPPPRPQPPGRGPARGPRRQPGSSAQLELTSGTPPPRQRRLGTRDPALGAGSRARGGPPGADRRHSDPFGGPAGPDTPGRRPGSAAVGKTGTRVLSEREGPSSRQPVRATRSTSRSWTAPRARRRQTRSPKAGTFGAPTIYCTDARRTVEDRGAVVSDRAP